MSRNALSAISSLIVLGCLQLAIGPAPCQAQGTVTFGGSPGTSVLVAGGGQQVLVVKPEGEARLYDTDTLETLAILPSMGGRPVALSPDGRLIAATTESGCIEVWDAGSGTTKLTLPVQDHQVVGFLNGGGLLVTSAHEDGRQVLCGWNSQRGKPVWRQTLDRPGAAWTTGLGGRMLFGVSGNGAVAVDARGRVHRPLNRDQRNRAPTYNGLYGMPKAVGVDPRGRWLALSLQTYTSRGSQAIPSGAVLELWDLRSGKLITTWQQPDAQPARTLVFSGRHIALQDASGLTSLFDLRTGARRARLDEGATAGLTADRVVSWNDAAGELRVRRFSDVLAQE